jgi:hypothetical protein
MLVKHVDQQNALKFSNAPSCAGTPKNKTEVHTVKSPNFVTAHNFVTNGQQFLEEPI